MKQIFKPLIGTFLLALFVTNVGASRALELPGPLIDADWLLENIGHVVLLDVRKDVDSFLKEGHIEGAVLVDTRKIRVNRKKGDHELIGMLPDRKEYEHFMSTHGIGTGSTVVITARGDTPGQMAGAARLYWQMKYYGFDRVALLDGGNRAWVDALGDLTNDATVFEPQRFAASTERNNILATVQDVEQALTDSDTLLVDTRNLRFHIGLEKRDYVEAYGHIPGSRLLPYKFLHPAKGNAVFYSTDVIGQALAALHIDLDRDIILYCNSAYECSSVWFALHELLGKKNVRIYDGSLNEWTMDDGHPMTREMTMR
jgi:thiosulfate/3-mercaptopyruvate sulfurtransferase